MSQYNFGDLSSPTSGTALINTHLEPWRNALHTMHSGSSRPSYAVAGLMWLDTTSTPWIVKMFDGTEDITIGTVNATTNAFALPSGNVALSNLANLAQDQFIGRITASTGVPETATITAAARTVLDDTTVATMVNTLGGAASSGSGGLIRATSPTINQPNIVGVTTNSSAAAGSVGEYIESVVASGSAVSLTTATAQNITSISLTAGDWDIDLVAQFTGGGTTTVTNAAGSISLVSNTLDLTAGRINLDAYPAGFALFGAASVASRVVPPLRLSLAATTTVYAVAYAGFAVSTCSAHGILRARRVR